MLPAHGGVLDLTDSLLFSFPAYLLVLTLLT
jgi:CDP-diglyceride synthetase